MGSVGNIATFFNPPLHVQGRPYAGDHDVSRVLADVCERTTIGSGTPSIDVLGTRPRIPCDRPTAGSMTFYPNLGFSGKDY
jgi:hypothetical protein